MKPIQALHASYKTPEQLGIADDIHAALVWFVDEFDAGNIKELPAYAKLRNTLIGLFGMRAGPPDFFLMSTVASKFDCGTAGCILGHITHRANIPNCVSGLHPTIFNLFYQRLVVDAKEARDATVRVLRGKPAWSLI